MEILSKELEFVEVGNDYSYNSGSGSGYGSDSGYGSGYGYGDGHGSGSLDDDGLKGYNDYNVYCIDGIPVVFENIKGNIAKVKVINNDMSTTNGYIVKHGDVFAHGDTLHNAQEALNEKLFEEMDVADRIELFKERFNDVDSYPAKDFFEWHNKLTGSCLFGRNYFVENNQIDMNRNYTVKEFIAICEDDYGGEIIQQLKESYR